MSTTTLETQQTLGTPAPLPYTPARTATLVLMAFAAVYVVWGSTYLAIRIGIESFPPLILAGLRHLIVGLFLYPVLRAKTR
ncbi:MAG: EamA family transporter, partial [Acidobacteria bacterium]